MNYHACMLKRAMLELKAKNVVRCLLHLMKEFYG
jgi:hypothetical protein